MGAVSDATRQAKEAVWAVKCPDFNSAGTGFFVTEDGHFVTNIHVISNIYLSDGYPNIEYSDDLYIDINGRLVSAQLVTDKGNIHSIVHDYAILTVDGVNDFETIDIAPNLDGVQQGDRVICLGYPLDIDNLVVTKGLVSALIRSPSHHSELHHINTILTDALVQFGNSGGPMFHIKTGNVIGVNTRKHDWSTRLREKIKEYTRNKKEEIKNISRYLLKRYHIGLNHAVSTEYISDRLSEIN